MYNTNNLYQQLLKYLTAQNYAHKKDFLVSSFSNLSLFLTLKSRQPKLISVSGSSEGHCSTRLYKRKKKVLQLYILLSFAPYGITLHQSGNTQLCTIFGHFTSTSLKKCHSFINKAQDTINAEHMAGEDDNGD